AGGRSGEAPAPRASGRRMAGWRGRGAAADSALASPALPSSRHPARPAANPGARLRRSPCPQAPPHPEMPAPEVLRKKEEAPPVPEPPARRPLTRWAWQGAGLSLVGLGTLGAVVPGLPTTVFFIGAAACFARSSPRLERWVL